jgi:hypothetical protein
VEGYPKCLELQNKVTRKEALAFEALIYLPTNLSTLVGGYLICKCFFHKTKAHTSLILKNVKNQD